MNIRISDDAECVENVGHLPGVNWEYELPGDGWYPDNTVTIMCHEVNINSLEMVGILITRSLSCVTR